MLATETQAARPLSPRPGEMVLVGQKPGCIIRVIGVVDGACWVETSASPYGVVQRVLYDTGRSRIWSVRPYGAG